MAIQDSQLATALHGHESRRQPQNPRTQNPALTAFDTVSLSQFAMAFGIDRRMVSIWSSRLAEGTSLRFEIAYQRDAREDGNPTLIHTYISFRTLTGSAICRTLPEDEQSCRAARMENSGARAMLLHSASEVDLPITRSLYLYEVYRPWLFRLKAHPTR